MSRYQMSKEEIKLLSKIKSLVRQGKCHFVPRKDRNYLDDLANLQITIEEAWNHVLSLNENMYGLDKKAKFRDNTDSLLFYKLINQKLAYIKVGIDKDEVEAELWSFHENGK